MRTHFEFWNIIDLLVAMLSTASLAMMAAATSSNAIDIDLLRCFQATAGLLGGIKLLSFLRGLDFSAFLISMLEAIVADMTNFFAVLLIIMVSCVHASLLRSFTPRHAPDLDVLYVALCMLYIDMYVQLCIRILLAPPGFPTRLPDHLQLHYGAGTRAFAHCCVDRAL